MILITFYPNLPRILQQADVGAFKPLKGYWETAVVELTWQHPFKERFAKVLEKAIQSALQPATV